MKYRVLVRLESLSTGRITEPGEVISLDESEAVPLLAVGAVEPMPEKTKNKAADEAEGGERITKNG